MASCEGLPIGDGELDAAVLFLVLHYVTEPAAALAEVARVLRPGGRLLLVDMTPHDREEYRQADGSRLARLRQGALEGWVDGGGPVSR